MTIIANQDQEQNQKQDLTLSNLVLNFPFKEIRPKQIEVLQLITDAINTGYKYIVLEHNMNPAVFRQCRYNKI